MSERMTESEMARANLEGPEGAWKDEEHSRERATLAESYSSLSEECTHHPSTHTRTHDM